MSTIVDPPVGTPVQYWYQADSRELPGAGIVLEPLGNGMVRLAVMSRAMGEKADLKPVVCHLSDPQLRDAKGNPTARSLLEGAWDFHPWFHPPKEMLAEYALASAKQLIAEGKTFDQVWNIVKFKFKGITKAALKLLFEKNDLPLAA